jgi:hypothetical protein
LGAGNCKALRKELEKLKSLFEAGGELKLVWTPDDENKLAGEVKGETIFIYERDEANAVETLRHEFIDYIVSTAIKPYEEVAACYRTMINALLQKAAEEAYRRKEKTIEAIEKALTNSERKATQRQNARE